MKYLLALFLLAVPLSAQQTVPIPIPDQTIRIEAPPSQVEVNLLWPKELPEELAEALADAYAEAAEPGIALLADHISQDQNQEKQGAGTTERIIKTAGWWTLGIIALVKLHQIATRKPNITNINVTHEDGDIHVTVPAQNDDHHHDRHKDDDGESGKN